MEEDDKIREMFSSFGPPLSSGLQFMTKLQDKMEAVEMVKRHSAMIQRRNRISMIVAASVGFLTGVVLTLLYPYIVGLLGSLHIEVPYLSMVYGAYTLTILPWIVVAAISVFLSVNAYEITVALLAVKSTNE